MPNISVQISCETADEIVKKTLIETVAMLNKFPSDDDSFLYEATLRVLEYFSSEQEYKEVIEKLRNDTLWNEQIAEEQRFDY